MSQTPVRFDFEPYALPLVAPLRTAAGDVRERRGWVVRLLEGDAVVGLGDVAPLPRAGTESHAEASEAIEQMSKVGGGLQSLLPEIAQLQGVSQERLEPREWEQRLQSALPHLPALRFGLDLALWDRAARRRNSSLASLLNPAAVPAVVANSLVTDDVCSAEAITDLLEAGFEVFKLKIGSSSVDEDRERIGRLRSLIGGRASIRLDANGGWASIEEAVAALDCLGLECVSSLEQPLPRGTEAEWGPLQALVPCLAADESVTSEEEASRLIDLGTVDALVLKPMRIGGLGACLRIASAAKRAGLEVWITTLLESAIGRAACLHVASALGTTGTRPHGLLTGPLLRSDVAPSLEGSGPDCRIDTKVPGLGVHIARPRATAVGSTCSVENKPRLRAQLRSGGEVLSTEELLAEVSQLSQQLRPGERLGILTDRSVSTALGICAAQTAGASAVLIDARLQTELQKERIRDSGIGILLAEGELSRQSLPVPGETPATPAPALLVFTSGTTGRARMAKLSWEALECSARAVAAATGLGPEDCWLSPLPLAHIGGVGVLFRALHSGATAEFLEGFDPEELVSRIRSGEVTHLSLVARMLERIVEVAEGNFSGSALRWVLVGGGATPPELIARARSAGLPIATTYGLTEAGSTVSLHHPDSELSGPRDTGWVLPHLELKIGASSLEEPGEILLRGSSLFGGYAGEEGRLSESWFATGDYGRLSGEGRLHLEDRRQDLIVSGGENVYPVELESRLSDRPEIEEVCVLGLPDPTWGQRVVAVLRLSPLSKHDPEAALRRLESWCAAEFPPWQRPRDWEVRDQPLPRTALLKLKRAELRDQFSASDERD